MKWITLYIAPLLILVALAGVLLARRQPPDDTARRFLLAEGCAPPCWQGIRPGSTRIDEALLYLRSSRYVDHIAVGYSADARSGIIRWTWRDLPPVSPAQEGYLYIYDNLVTEIELETLIPLGEIWLLLDAPQFIDRVSIQGAEQRHYSHYRRGDIVFWVRYTCPLSALAFWRSPVNARYSDYTFDGYSLDVQPPDRLLMELCS